MPRVNIYLNEADYEKWLEIPNKSLFVAAAINDVAPPAAPALYVEPPTITPKQHAALHPEPKTTTVASAPALGFACCLSKKKQCKHWQWDDVQQLLVNNLTGEVVDVSL